MNIKGIAYSIVLLLSNCFGINLQILDYKPIVMIEEENPNNVSTRTDVTMPFFVGDSIISKRMNLLLYFKEIEQMAPESLSSQIGAIDNRVLSFDYEVYTNNANSISLSVHASGCGASCGSHTNYYNFDANTGRLIGSNDLIRTDSLQSFSTQLRKSYKNRITQICTDYFKDQYPNDDPSSAIRIWPEEIGGNTPAYLVFLCDQFYIKNDSIHYLLISPERTVENAEIVYSLQQISSYLSDYGKQLFFVGQTKQQQPVHVIDQVFWGKIGKAKIGMVLSEPYLHANYIEGFYYYAKYKKAIPIVGNYDGKELILHEKNNNNKIVATIHATRYNDGYKGIWNGAAGKMSFQIFLK